tara:strand:+ start:22318 stop:23634 length:1317 start_codon:yes stop_codon:yes gene_type:complete
MDASRELIVLENVQVLDIRTGQLAEHQSIIVRNGLIEAVNDSNQIDRPAGSIQIDGANRVVIPGLVDMHVHIWDESDLAANLVYGVTTVRNLNGMPHHLPMAERIENGTMLGPRLITTGPIINERDGRNADFTQALVSSPASASAEVQRQYAAGYRHLKVYSNLAPDNYQAILDEARALGMSVTGHPVEGHRDTEIDFSDLLDDGLSTLEHVESVVWHALDDEIDDRAAWELAREIAVSHQTITPTLVVHENLTSLITTQGEHARREGMDTFNPLVFEYDEDTYEHWARSNDTQRIALDGFYRRVTGLFHQAGVPLVVGTDAGVMVTLPGRAAIREIELFVEVGLTPLEALQSATLTPARVLGLEDRIGDIRTGYSADFVVLDANPLLNLSTLYRPSAVMRGGVWLETDDLDTLRSIAEAPSYERSAQRLAEHMEALP